MLALLLDGPYEGEKSCYKESKVQHDEFRKQYFWSKTIIIIWDLIIHGPAHRGANGTAMPTDEDDQDGHFFFDHPERGGYSAA